MDEGLKVCRRWLRLSELHKKSGIPVITLKKWCARGAIPARKVGKVWEVDIERMLQNNADLDWVSDILDEF